MPRVKQETELTKRLKAQARAAGVRAPSAPLWAGPAGGGPQGGVTYSLLSRYLVCKERFRLYVMDGLRGADRFSHRMEYGNMWHACEEALAGCDKSKYDAGYFWQQKLKEYAAGLVKRYPFQSDEIEKWYQVCKIQFPLYVDYWRKHPDVQKREPLIQEQAFDVPYPLPSGRVVRLRGKWDSVDYVKAGPNKGVWIQENKTKGDIDEGALQAQLSFDLQSMIYVVALEYTPTLDGVGLVGGSPKRLVAAVPRPIRGVRYNVVRRPLSGGAGNIKQHKPSKKNPAGETAAEYYARLGDVLADHLNPDGTSRQFMRWEVPVTAGELEAFRRTCLDPLLDNLLDDYEWWAKAKEKGLDPFNACERAGHCGVHTSRHYRHPYGVRNSIDEGYGTDLDEYMRTGSEVGLVRVKNLFKELQP